MTARTSSSFNCQKATGRSSRILLQATQDIAQPLSYFANLPAIAPYLTLQVITNASHFTNFDQPGQVAVDINAFLAAH